MDYRPRFILVFLICSLMMGNPAIASSSNDILVDSLLTEVQRALITVQNSTTKEQIPSLESVVLSLSTQFDKKGGAKLNLYVISLGTKISKNTTHSVVLKLIPPKPGTRTNVSTNSVSEQLANAIIEAAKGTHNATKRDPPLSLSEVSVNIKFVVRTEGTAGVNFTLIPVTVDLGGELQAEATQEITVTFKDSK